MPRQRNVIRNGHAITQVAIVSHMRAGHDETIRTYQSHRTRPRSPVHRHAFAYSIPCADSQIAFMLREADVLRLSPKHRALVNDVVRSKRCESLHAGVGANFAAFANFSIGLDHRIRPYRNTGSNSG